MMSNVIIVIINNKCIITISSTKSIKAIAVSKTRNWLLNHVQGYSEL